MSGLESIGKVLIGVGIFLLLSGIIFVFWQKIPFLGRLPGDIIFQRGGGSFYFPLATSLIISLILTVLLNIVFRLFK